MTMNWKHMVGAAVLTGTLGYMFGHMDGAAPPGTKPSVAAVQDASQTGQQYVHSGVQAGQGLVGEAGSLTATAGNAASSAGNSVQNTVPGAPPKAPG